MDMLNKDIEILREFTESSCHLYSQEEIIEATKNVLLELEKKNYNIKALEEDNIHLMKYASDVLKTNDKLAENVETWKKITEKLGEFVGFRTTGCPYIPKKPCHNNIDYGKSCKECIIDWTKNEVLKNE